MTSGRIAGNDCFVFDSSSALKMETFDKLPNALTEMMVVLGLDESSAFDCLVNILC